MHAPVCRKCQREFRPQTIGVRVLDMAEFGPYKLWMADVYQCPVCGAEIVYGFADKPFAQAGDDKLKQELEWPGPVITSRT